MEIKPSLGRLVDSVRWVKRATISPEGTELLELSQDLAEVLREASGLEVQISPLDRFQLQLKLLSGGGSGPEGYPLAWILNNAFGVMDWGEFSFTDEDPEDPSYVSLEEASKFLWYLTLVKYFRVLRSPSGPMAVFLSGSYWETLSRLAETLILYEAQRLLLPISSFQLELLNGRIQASIQLSGPLPLQKVDSLEGIVPVILKFLRSVKELGDVPLYLSDESPTPLSSLPVRISFLGELLSLDSDP